MTNQTLFLFCEYLKCFLSDSFRRLFIDSKCEAFLKLKGRERLVAVSSNITDTVMEWMPLIITFAMLGMVLGMLKKFGKF